jgi:hypothetical protein
LQSDQGIAGKLAQRIVAVVNDIKNGKIDRVKGQSKIHCIFTAYLHESYDSKDSLFDIVKVLTDRKNDLSSI